ncbi:sensor histidine kinase [Novosphingobium colocasiae]
MAGLLCGAFAWYFFVAPRVGPIITARTITSMLFYAGVVTIDIVLVHLMQRANRRLADARENVRLLAEERGQLAERAQVLFQELQHRVGNNLQMVGAVLALQLRTLKEPTARQAISDAAARLTVIGRIQRQLYSPDGRMVALDTFIRQVAEAVMASSGRPGTECRIEAEEGIDVGSESAVPIALILTEAIANALEHALPDGANGVIEIDVRREGELVALTVRDHGAGLPDGFFDRCGGQHRPAHFAGAERAIAGGIPAGQQPPRHPHGVAHTRRPARPQPALNGPGPAVSPANRLSRSCLPCC